MSDLERLLAAGTASGGVSPMVIRSAETALGVTFPPSYRRFLAEYGAILSEGFEIAGLPGEERSGPKTPFWSDVVHSTQRTRRASRGGIPQQYVQIADDGGDYSFYLDTSVLNEAEECPVVALGPGVHGVVVAKDFEEFVVRLATWQTLLR